MDNVFVRVSDGGVTEVFREVVEHRMQDDLGGTCIHAPGGHVFRCEVVMDRG